mmetsp:Transcript_15841/g.20713  ORF Transcript_15841/g.20713 Transcript_15841/m.20713 type:complete len:119 (-) Transcript_15841:448-804(-)
MQHELRTVDTTMIQLFVEGGHRTKNNENLAGIWWNDLTKKLLLQQIDGMSYIKTEKKDWRDEMKYASMSYKATTNNELSKRESQHLEDQHNKTKLDDDIIYSSHQQGDSFISEQAQIL